MDGSLLCWGNRVNTPTFLAESNAPFVDVAIANSTQCYVLATGEAYCWGYGQGGQLGDGTTVYVQPTRVQVGLYSDFASIDGPSTSLGWNTLCGVHMDGTVSCWGGNDEGELGTGTADIAAHSLPSKVIGMSGVAEVAVGESHVCARRTDGTVSCWGQNGLGRLGRGNEIPGVFAPADVVGVTGATRLFVGASTTCVMLSDRTLSCWGYNEDGGLGDGTEVSRGTPMVVPMLAGVVHASVGDFHTCAVIDGGSIRCWGRGGSGRLGNGTNLAEWWATTGPSVTGAVEVWAGMDHTCALFADSEVRCWGENNWRQIGDGTNTDRYVPTSPAF